MRDALHSLPLLAALAGALLLGSCGLLGSDENETENTNTYFRATLNGEEEWSGSPYGIFTEQGRFNSYLVINADSIHGSRHYGTQLGFSIPFHGSDEYSLTATVYEINEAGVLHAGASFVELDWDVRIATYRATGDSSANQLTITSYDSTAGMVEGTFRTTVVVDSSDREAEPGEPPRRRADTLRFTDGEFRVKLRDRRDE